jgi:hypothetical protein
MRAAGSLENAIDATPAEATAIHAVVGGVAAALGGGNAAQGALGAGASEAVSSTMSDYLANHGIDPNSTAGQSLMNLGSAIIGGAVGGGAGASTALAGEQFNRQLHPSEQQLAQTLAANSNGQYTVQQVEDAMRLSGYSLGVNSVMPGETAQTGTLVNANDPSSIYDTNANWQPVAGPNGSQYLMQVVSSWRSAYVGVKVSARKLLMNTLLYRSRTTKHYCKPVHPRRRAVPVRMVCARH